MEDNNIRAGCQAQTDCRDETELIMIIFLHETKTNGKHLT